MPIPRPVVMGIFFYVAVLAWQPTRAADHQPTASEFQPILLHLAAPRQAIDLAGKWQAYPSRDGHLPASADQWQETIVPGEHQPLFSKKQIGTEGCVFFRRTLPAAPEGKQVFVCFERVSDTCEVLVNGKSAGHHTEGYFSFRLNITPFLQTGENELIVRVNSVGETGMKDRPLGWSWYYPLFYGIPFPVHLEYTDAVVIDDVFVRPYFRDQAPASPALKTVVTLRNDSAVANKRELRAAVESGPAYTPRTVELAAGQTIEIELDLPWTTPRLWSPDDPHLYFLTLSLNAQGQTTDAYRQRFGFRQVTVDGHRLRLNGIPVFQRRDSIIPYRNLSTPQKCAQILATLKKRGYNGVRLHGISSTRFLFAADEAGILMSPESGVNEPRAHELSDNYWPNAQEHLEAMARHLRNHASLFYYCLSNEFASYYMKGTDPEKAKVDNWLVDMGSRICAIDPGAFWTASGDGELGGVGRHGPAPALSFHYAWQPFKPVNTLPNTAYWAEEGGRPWQGIVWDRTKPLILSEDMYAPYCFKPPFGMTAWAGDRPYDLTQYYDAWFEMLRIFAAGYYHAQVSVWNPWATNASGENNPLFAGDRQPMPEYLIAVRELTRTFASGESAIRTVAVHNQTFLPVKGHFSAVLREADKVIGRIDRELPLGAGSAQEFALTLPLPRVRTKTLLQWELVWSRPERELARLACPLTVYPERPEIHLPARTALLGATDAVPEIDFPLGRFTTLEEALAVNPEHLVLAGWECGEAAPRLLLEKAVRNGLSVLWLEVPLTGWRPLRLDPDDTLSPFAFRRSPDDPALAGITDNDLGLWRPDGYAVRHAFFKPQNAIADILLDSGSSGLIHTPLLRISAGRGSMLLCQLPVLRSSATEPAARWVLAQLLNNLEKHPDRPRNFAALSPSAKPMLAEAFKKAGIPLGTNMASDVVIFNGAVALTAPDLEQITRLCESGKKVFIDRVGSATATTLTTLLKKSITLRPLSVYQVIHESNASLLAGLNNHDLFWGKYQDFEQQSSLLLRGKTDYVYKGTSMLTAELTVDGATTMPLRPAGLAIIPFLNGQVVLSTLNWAACMEQNAVKPKAVIGRVLYNLGALTAKDALPGRFNQVNLAKFANREFWQKEDSVITGWFGDEKDDLRYFPVNRTGIDPVLKVPAPVEEFPAAALNLGGIDFLLVNPENNGGKGCLVLRPGAQTNVNINHSFLNLWFLGALEKHLIEGTPAGTVTLRYADGSIAHTTLQAGAQLQGYQYPTEVKEGVCAWRGITPTRQDAVLWAFAVVNPQPEKKVSDVEISAPEQTGLAVVAITYEH